LPFLEAYGWSSPENRTSTSMRAIFLLNYEDICFVMKDWPRPDSDSDSNSDSDPRSACIQLSHCNPYSTANCVVFVFLYFFLFLFFFGPFLFFGFVVRLVRETGSRGVGEFKGLSFQFCAAGRNRIVNFAFV